MYGDQWIMVGLRRASAQLERNREQDIGCGRNGLAYFAHMM